MTEDEQNEYLDTLYQLSKASYNQNLSIKAMQVYTSLKNQMVTRLALNNMIQQP
jgi:hypothetical protein